MFSNHCVWSKITTQPHIVGPENQGISFRRAEKRNLKFPVHFQSEKADFFLNWQKLSSGLITMWQLSYLLENRHSGSVHWFQRMCPLPPELLTVVDFSFCMSETTSLKSTICKGFCPAYPLVSPRKEIPKQVITLENNTDFQEKMLCSISQNKSVQKSRLCLCAELCCDLWNQWVNWWRSRFCSLSSIYFSLHQRTQWGKPRWPKVSEGPVS